MNRRVGILAGLAALIPLASEAKRHAHKHRALAAQSLCGCSLTFAYYAASFTPGPEDVSVVQVDNLTITLPDPSLNAGREWKLVGDGPSRSRRMIVNDFDGTYFIQTPGVFVCDGTRWYLAANF